jgi:acetyl esterase/lipase
LSLSNPHRIIFLWLLLAGSLCGIPGSGLSEPTERLPSGITVHKNLVYSKVDRELTMDLFIPESSPEPVPCVIVIQGGGFNARDGQRFRPFAEYLADNGFAAALIAYRGRPDHTFLATIADTKAAVRYVRKISGQYRIDSENIGAMGSSAGGTLAVLQAVTGGMKKFEGGGGHPEYSSRIQAAVGYSGVYDFAARFTDKQQIKMQPRVENKIESNGEWIGVPFTPTDTHWLDASAINHIDTTDPPVLLLHCKDDTVVPWLQSQNMYEKLQAAGIHTEITYYETGGHGYRIEDPEEPMARMVTFFRKVFTH